MEDTVQRAGESSRPSTSARDDRREVDSEHRRDRDDRDKSSSSRRRDDDERGSSRRERDRDDYRRRDDDRDRRRSDRRDDDGRDKRRERRASPSGREADRDREEPPRDDRRSRDYDRERDRNGSDRRRDRDDGDGYSRRRERRDYDDDRQSGARRRSSRSPPASGSRRDGSDYRSNGRRDTREDGPSTSTSASHGLPPLQTDEPASQGEVKQFVPPTKESILAQRAKAAEAGPAKRPVRLIEVIANDRLGGKVRVKCSPKDTVGDLKKLIAVQKGTKPEKIVLKKWYTIYKDHIALEDYEIHDGMSLEMS